MLSHVKHPYIVWEDDSGQIKIVLAVFLDIVDAFDDTSTQLTNRGTENTIGC